MKEIKVCIGDLLLKAILLRQIGNQGIIYCQDRIVTATFDRTAEFWHSDYAQTVLLDLCDVNLQSDEDPTFVGGVIKPRSIRDDKDDRDVDNGSDAAKAKEEKWLTNEFLDNLEYVDTPNQRGSCGSCALLRICNDLEFRDKVVKSEDVRIRTRDIVRRCLDANGYYIKKDK